MLPITLFFKLTFIRYTQNRKIGKSNNLTFWELSVNNDKMEKENTWEQLNQRA
jgi:hypothetical protein